MIRSALAAGLATLFVCVATARGEERSPKDTASQLVDEGNALVTAKRYDEALDRYRRAYQIFPSPKIFLNIAEAHRAVGRVESALEAYQHFLDDAKLSSGSPIAESVRTRMASLKSNSGYLSLTSTAAKVEVTIDQAISVRLPRDPIALLKGKHTIDATAPDKLAQHGEVMIEAGESVSLELHFAEAPRLSVLRDESQAPPVTRVEVERERESEESQSGWWMWALVGIAAVAAGGVVIYAATKANGDGFMPMGELGRSNTSTWRHF
jgi:hypothetical protein